MQDLLGLWRGDEESTGYIHEGLAREICRALKPATSLALFENLYPGCAVEDVEQPIRKVIFTAFAKWERERH